MEVIEVENTAKSMRCSDCGLPLFQKDKEDKFFLFSCRGCGHEVQLDHEFSWETCKVNNKSILPNVKRQRDSTCDPHAIVTAVEGDIRFHCARQKVVFEESLSVDDLIKQYEDKMDPGFKWDSNEKGSRTKSLRELMKTNGVLSDKDFKSRKKTGIRYKAKSTTEPPSFEDSCNKILKGSLLHTSIRICNNFDTLGGDEIYIPDLSRPIIDSDIGDSGIGVINHAIVLVGFGMKRNVQYFRFMNSHGTRFGKNGFGSVHAPEISSVTSFKPLMQ